MLYICSTFVIRGDKLELFAVIYFVLAHALFFFFFFKQKTAYEIGTGDWSSDVCSSDLKDVTAVLHPALRSAAERAARVLDIPVTGLDFLVPDVTQPEHVIVEANERPGLANHEPQPTAARFVDLLFPLSQTPEDPHAQAAD